MHSLALLILSIAFCSGARLSGRKFGEPQAPIKDPSPYSLDTRPRDTLCAQLMLRDGRLRPDCGRLTKAQIIQKLLPYLKAEQKAGVLPLRQIIEVPEELSKSGDSSPSMTRSSAFKNKYPRFDDDEAKYNLAAPPLSGFPEGKIEYPRFDDYEKKYNLSPPPFSGFPEDKIVYPRFDDYEKKYNLSPPPFSGFPEGEIEYPRFNDYERRYNLALPSESFGDDYMEPVGIRFPQEKRPPSFKAAIGKFYANTTEAMKNLAKEAAHGGKDLAARIKDIFSPKSKDRDEGMSLAEVIQRLLNVGHLGRLAVSNLDGSLQFIGKRFETSLVERLINQEIVGVDFITIRGEPSVAFQIVQNYVYIIPERIYLQIFP